jgi:hypothetical protein
MSAKVVTLAAGLSLLSLAVHGQSCVSQEYSNNTAAQIGIQIGSGWESIGTSSLTNGAAMWSTCSDYGYAFPTIQVGGFPGTITITANYVGQASGGNACSQTQVTTNAAGQVISATIFTYASSNIYPDCSVIRDSSIAHELGHVLGLNDSACTGYVMGPPIANRSVQSAECTQVDNQWTTPAENQQQPPPPVRYCNPELDPTYQPDCMSPIVINLGQGGYELSGANDPVTFDINATGAPQRISWTARGAAMAFLALDRNGDGVINDGSELFGNHTPLPRGIAAANGFDALAQYDANSDGILDANDPIWSSLLLWTDLNHDGISQPAELASLSSSKVTAIGLHDHWTGRRDVFGNMYRYQSQVWMTNPGGQARATPVYDIFFVP